MATEVVKIIDPDSGTGYDYTSLSNWNTNEQGDLTGVRDEIAIAKLRCTGGTNDTTAATISGWTTSATQYIKIWTDPSESYRHPGYWLTGNYYRLVVTGGTADALILTEQYIIVEGIMAEISNATDTVIRFDVDYASGWLKISDCILRAPSSTATGEGCIDVGLANRAASPGFEFWIWNNLCYDFSNAGCFGINVADAGLAYIYNNTVQNCDEGITQVTTYYNIAAVVKNNLIQDCVENFKPDTGSWGTASTHNVGDISTIAELAFGATWTTGTSDATNPANKLEDLTKNFNTIGVQVGSIVEDSASNHAYVTAIDSDTVLSLSADIIGNSEAYTIYKNMVGNATFSNEAGDIFHLTSSDTVALDKGVNLTSDTNLPVTDDVLGTSRPQGTAFDIGFYELLQTPELDPASGEIAFGEVSPSGGEDPIEWSTFSNGAGGSPEVIGDADWGKIAVESGEVAHSQVYDFTTSTSRTITLTKDVYGSGAGNPTIQIRGHDSTLFAKDDASPSWETYSAPVAKTWRYIQVRIIYSA